MAEISEKELKEMRQELANIRSVAMIKWPFFASLLGKCRIIADRNEWHGAVNTRNELIINPDYLKKADDIQKIFTYIHEAGHIGFSHPQRTKGRNNDLANISADCVINSLLFAHGFDENIFSRDRITAKKISELIKKDEEEVARMSFEQLYSLLEKHCENGNPLPETERDIFTEKDIGKNGKVIQEGDPQAYKAGATPEEREKYWKDALVKAAIQAKMAGRLPADVELIINNLLKAKVDWKSVIKKLILNGFGRNTISTWRKSSRKHELLPGIVRFTKPNLHLLIDTSGSTVSLMPQFLGETSSLIKNQGKGIIYPWDAQAYPTIELKKTVDLGYAIKKKKIKGGGGTVIAPVLKIVLESIKNGDVTVIITDGAIGDIGDGTTQELLRKLSQKSSQTVFASMDTTVDVPPRWKKVKIEI